MRKFMAKIAQIRVPHAILDDEEEDDLPYTYWHAAVKYGDMEYLMQVQVLLKQDNDDNDVDINQVDTKTEFY